MMKKNLSCLFMVYMLVSNLYGQQEIPIIKENKCDTTHQVYNLVKIEMRDVPCLKDMGKDFAICFTNEKAFQDFMDKNKSANCNAKNDSMFDFNKYDIVLVRLAIKAGYSNYSMNIMEKEKSYSMNLNFYMEKDKSPQKPHEYGVSPNLLFYSHYFIFPKGKTSIPEFHIYETNYKCF